LKKHPLEYENFKAEDLIVCAEAIFLGKYLPRVIRLVYSEVLRKISKDVCRNELGVTSEYYMFQHKVVCCNIW
jgi:hypothetical protein